MHLGINVDDLVAGSYKSLGQRNTHGQGFELARRRHHHCMRDAVENQRDRPLLSDVVRRNDVCAIAMA